MGQRWPAAASETLNAAVAAWGLLKEVAIIFITSTIVWSQVNNREGPQPRPSTENCIRLTEHGPTNQNKTQFLP